jgi:3-deoxy-D-manno-octulosonate 8-phosphate phosphatase (KDO 8-P phosphatase)
MTRIRCLILDVDGVLTDGRLYYDEEGRAGRAFHVQDGLAIRVFQRLGGVVVIVTGKVSRAVPARAAELGIEYVIQGSRDKRNDVASVLSGLGIDPAETAVMGDDLPDLGMMRHCGYALAPADAVAEVRAMAHHVTLRCGGAGAVREAVEHLLRRDGRWEGVVAEWDPDDARGDKPA